MFSRGATNAKAKRGLAYREKECEPLAQADVQVDIDRVVEDSAAANRARSVSLQLEYGKDEREGLHIDNRK